MKINKLQTAWTTIKRLNEEPLETRKVATGETYKRKVGLKQVGWKEVPWYGAAGNGDSNYFGEAYTKPVPIYEDIYEDVPRYREEYLYPEEPKPQLVKKSSTKQYIAPLDNRPHVKVPQQYKEGLATILNGLTYYKFDGYSPEQVQLAIASIIGKQQPKIQDVYYEPDEPPVLNTVTEESVKLKPSAEEVVAKILGDTEKPADKEPADKKPELKPTNKKPELKSIVKPVETKEVETDLTDKGVFMYRYPQRKIHTYNIQPEIAELVKDLLKNQTPTELENSKQSYFYTDKPLYNLPEGFATDSIYHNIFKSDSYLLSPGVIDRENNIYDETIHRDFWELLAGGLYRPNNDPVYYSYLNHPREIQVTENLAFVPASGQYLKLIPNTYEWVKEFIYNDNKGNPVLGTYMLQKSNKNPLSSVQIDSTGMKTYPYNETIQKLKALKKANEPAQNTDTLKLKAKNFVGSLLNIFK